MNTKKKTFRLFWLNKTTKRKSRVQGLDLDHIISRGKCVEICRHLNTDGENKYANKRFKLWEIEYFLSDYVFFSFLCCMFHINLLQKLMILNGYLTA